VPRVRARLCLDASTGLILVRMNSLGDACRTTLRERMAQLSAEERIALTARLAEQDLDTFCDARGLARDEGRHLLAARRSAGRRRSCLNEVER
jgi:hypothetical protein